MNLNKTFLILFLVVATELIGFGLIIPVLPVLASYYEISHFLLGILMASFSIAQFIASPILGALSDKFGRKPILVISKLGTVISYIILAYADSYYLFLVARLLDGFTGGNIAVARAYVSDITDNKTRSKGMAIIGISFGIGFILGPILGAVLYKGLNGQLLTALIAGFLSFLAMLFTIFLLKEPKVHKPSTSIWTNLKHGITELRKSHIILVFSTYLFYMIIFSGFETTFSMYLKYVFTMNLNQIMWMFVFSGLIGLIVQGYISRKTISKFKLFTSMGILSLSVSFFGLALFDTFNMLLIFLTFLSISISIVVVFMPSLLSTSISSKKLGVVMGMYEGVGSLGRIIGPLVAYLLPLSQIRFQYTLYGIVLFGVFLVFSFFSVRLKQKLI